MDLDLGRKSCVGWAEAAPEDAGADFVPAKESLCVLRKKGFRDTRYPVHIARNRVWEGKLRTDEEIGEGFVYVPQGPFLYGEGEETRTVVLPAFAIAKYPVTFREYVEFLPRERNTNVGAG